MANRCILQAMHIRSMELHMVSAQPFCGYAVNSAGSSTSSWKRRPQGHSFMKSAPDTRWGVWRNGWRGFCYKPGLPISSQFFPAKSTAWRRFQEFLGKSWAAIIWGCPRWFKDCQSARGLVLVTGPTGREVHHPWAIVHEVNMSRKTTYHREDPEFVHRSEKPSSSGKWASHQVVCRSAESCSREIPTSSWSWNERPGNMPLPWSLGTGHLVFATLHRTARNRGPHHRSFSGQPAWTNPEYPADGIRPWFPNPFQERDKRAGGGPRNHMPTQPFETYPAKERPTRFLPWSRRKEIRHAVAGYAILELLDEKDQSARRCLYHEWQASSFPSWSKILWFTEV